MSIDWFKGKITDITGTSHISRENLWFPVHVDFPLSQPIENALS